MIYSYIYNENCLYIPMHLNLIKDKNTYNLTEYKNSSAFSLFDQVTKSFIEKICDFIDNENGYNYFLLDFTRISMADSRVFEAFNDLLTIKNKEIIFYSLESRIYSFILEDDCKNNIYKDQVDKSTLSTSKGWDYYKKVLNNKNTLSKNIKIFKTKLVAEYLFDKVTKYKTNTQWIYLPSSNVYSNMYIDVKSLFSDHRISNLAIYELCSLIVDNFKKDDYDYLVCASNNGAALATIIGLLLNKKVCYLMNLGPNLTIRDNEFISKIKPGKKYIYIYDFICLGTEYKLASTIIKIKGSDVIAGIGISHFVDIDRWNQVGENRKNRLFSLFDVNDKQYKFEYDCKITGI